MVGLYMGQTQERVVSQPPALHHHLDQVDDVETSDQPALVSTHVQHRLQTQWTLHINSAVMVILIVNIF